MDTYNLIAIVTTLTALLAFLNARFLKLPAAIGIMMLALVLSLALMLLSTLGVPLERRAEQVFGAALGAIGYGLLRQVDNYAVEVLMTLAMVTGGYALAMHWHLSGPLAVVVAGLIAIPLVLAIPFVCVSLPILLMRARREFTPGVIRILTWGGLRGGISIALVLSLPAGAERDQLLTVTFLVVVFSILVQMV